MAINDASVERTWKVKTKGIYEIELEEMYNSFRRSMDIQYLEAGQGEIYEAFRPSRDA